MSSGQKHLPALPGRRPFTIVVFALLVYKPHCKRWCSPILSRESENNSMLPLLYQDEDLLAVAKPEDLATIPERRPTGDSLVERLTRQLGIRLFVVHRLDKEVSGVVLMAKHAAAHSWLNDQFSARRVEKTYLAVVYGHVAADRGTVDLPLRQFGSGRMGVDRGRGKASSTGFAVLARSGAFSFLKVSPLTGRRHQIRVHLYAMGHPIVGDRRYGDLARQRRHARIMLHAHTITCLRPDGTPVCIEAPAPASWSILHRQLWGCEPPLPTGGAL